MAPPLAPPWRQSKPGSRLGQNTDNSRLSGPVQYPLEKVPARVPRPKVRDSQQIRQSVKHQDDAQEEEDDAESDAMIRVRIRQRIQQRVLGLQAASYHHHSLQSSTCPEARGGGARWDGQDHRVIEMETLHEGVVHTAAQILERYLEKNQRDDALELTLVHRMLAKEVELQALQRQRGTMTSSSTVAPHNTREK